MPHARNARLACVRSPALWDLLTRLSGAAASSSRRDVDRLKKRNTLLLGLVQQEADSDLQLCFGLSQHIKGGESQMSAEILCSFCLQGTCHKRKSAMCAHRDKGLPVLTHLSAVNTVNSNCGYEGVAVAWQVYAWLRQQRSCKLVMWEMGDLHRKQMTTVAAFSCLACKPHPSTPHRSEGSQQACTATARERQGA